METITAQDMCSWCDERGTRNLGTSDQACDTHFEQWFGETS